LASPPPCCQKPTSLAPHKEFEGECAFPGEPKIIKCLNIVSSTQETQWRFFEPFPSIAILTPFPDMRRGFAASHLSSFKLNEEKHEQTLQIRSGARLRRRYGRRCCFRANRGQLAQPVWR